MRDKLIKLQKQAQNDWLQKEYEHETHKDLAEYVADHLIANNVFVLPEQMKDSWELTSAFVLRLFCANEEQVEKIKQEFELQKVRQILTDIHSYLVAIFDEWRRRSDEPHFIENNIGVYNHLRKELEDLEEYAKGLGIEL